jgi:hypothetical protein
MMASMKRLAALMILALAGCKPTPVKLEVMPSTIKFMSSGDTVILITHLSDKDGQPVTQHPPCTFVTNDALVADVRQDGTVTSNGGGSTEIHVHCEKLMVAVPVKVSLPSKVLLQAQCATRCDEVSQDPVVMKLDGIGASGKLVAKVVDEGGEVVPVDPKWEANDPQFRDGARRLGIELGREGEVRCTGVAGKYLVLATAGNAIGRAMVEVTLPNVDVVKAQGHIWVKPGAEAQIEPKGFRRAIDGLKPVDGARYNYSSNNVAVAKVNDEGKVTGVAEGIAELVVAADSAAFAQVSVTVSDKDPIAALPPPVPAPKPAPKAAPKGPAPKPKKR